MTLKLKKKNSSTLFNESVMLETEIEANSPKNFMAKLKRFLSFCGPGYMIAVGYMDPGNWATDIEAGSKYGYSLLYIILISNIMAVVLQHLCIRVGVYTRRDLAQNCRIQCHPYVNIFLYIVAELAIISCDLSEVIGTAIALNLLFGMPILWGVLLTVGDVLLLLAGFNSDNSSQYKILEFLVMALMSIVGGCFMIQVLLVKPDWKEVALGFIPRSTILFTDKDAIFSALGIIGATVMPHNLYLHSSIVKYRLPPPLPKFKSDNSDDEDEDADEEVASFTERDENPVKDLKASDSSELRYWDTLKSIIRYNTVDTLIALFLALLINAAILIVSAAAFNARGKTDVKHIEDASDLMKQWLGSGASILFGLALLAAGQSSTVTGTLAGQIVFEGFLRMKMAPWLRRIVTRVVAIVPAVLIIYWAGEESINKLLLYSQVVLSFQLPFAIIPLIIFAFPSKKQEASTVVPARKERPQIPKEANYGTITRCLEISSWIIAAIIISLNVIFPIISLQE
jgi:manganese transport protein